MATFDEFRDARRRDEGRLAAQERRVSYAEREQDLRDREADVFERAKMRATRSKMLSALNNPTRYAPQVAEWAKEEWRRNRVNEQEMAMLRQQGANAIGVAEANAAGMRDQGSTAAGYNRDAQIEVEKQRGVTELEKQRMMNESASEIEKQRGATEIEKQRIGSAATVEAAKAQADATKYQADATVDVQAKKNEGDAARYGLTLQQEARQFAQQKELAQMRIDAMAANKAELQMIDKLRAKKEYANEKTEFLLSLIRSGVKLDL